jgi:hypothetical protein
MTEMIFKVPPKPCVARDQCEIQMHILQLQAFENALNANG